MSTRQEQIKKLQEQIENLQKEEKNEQAGKLRKAVQSLSEAVLDLEKATSTEDAEQTLLAVIKEFPALAILTSKTTVTKAKGGKRPRRTQNDVKALKEKFTKEIPEFLKRQGSSVKSAVIVKGLNVAMEDKIILMQAIKDLVKAREIKSTGKKAQTVYSPK